MCLYDTRDWTQWVEETAKVVISIRVCEIKFVTHPYLTTFEENASIDKSARHIYDNGALAMGVRLYHLN